MKQERKNHHRKGSRKMKTKQLLEAIQQTQQEVQAAQDLCSGLAEAIEIGPDAWDSFLDLVEAGLPAARATGEVERVALEADAEKMDAEEPAAIHPTIEQKAEATEADLKEGEKKVVAPVAFAKAA